jgi:TonB-linked SusC/RagA family outer membrane protein
MKKKSTFLLLALVLFIANNIAIGQEKKTITGMVKDSIGTPLPGVSITVKNTDKHVLTNEKGVFKINAASSKDILVFSYIGFERKEVVAGSSGNLEIILKANTKQLEDVVVTALGIKKSQRSIGYATSTVKGEDLLKAAPTNFGSALAGQASGVMVTSNSGGATSAVSIQIRGLSSIGYQKQPLMVIDGIVMRNGEGNNAGYWNNQSISGNGLLDINPENIETINVLKGAAASALYGSDATFGVIVITTKGGKSSKGIGVELSLSSNVEKAVLLPDIQTKYGPGYDWVDNRGAFGNDSAWIQNTINGQTVNYPAFNNGGYQWGTKIDGRPVYYADGVTRPFAAHNYWQDFYRTGNSDIEHIALSNANDKASYRFSYTRNDYQGVQVGGKQQKNTFDLNTTIKISPQLTFNLTAAYSNELVHNRPRQIYYLTNNSGSFPNPGNYMNILFNKYQTPQGYKYYPASSASLDPVNAFKYDFDGEPFLDFLWSQLANSNNETTNRLISSATLTYNILPGLSLRSRLGTDITGYRQEYEGRSTQPIAFGPTGGYSLTTNQYNFISGDMLLSYNRKLNKDVSFTASAGYQGRKESYYNNSTTTVGGLSVENWFSISASSSQVGQASSFNQFLTKDGVFGILDLNYKDYLFVSGTLRHERTSTLAPGMNEFNYPGISGALELTKLLNLPTVIDYSKFRAAWGIVGNPPQVYVANQVYNPGNVNGVPTLAPQNASVGNPDLKNEFKHELEFGWETKLLKNRLGFDISYYTNTIYNQIVPIGTPSNVGATSVIVNLGTMNNHGVEGSVYGTPVRNKNFSWDTRINFGFNQNKVVSLQNGQSTYIMSNIDNNSMQVVANPGSPSGDIMGYIPETDGKGHKIVDGNGMYPIDKSHFVKVGNIQPKVVGGFLNTFTYKRFSLTALLDYHWGGQIISLARLYGTGQGVYKNSLYGRDAASGGLSYYSLNNGGMGTYVASNANGPNGEAVHHDGIILKGVTASGAQNTTMVDAPNYYINTFTWGAWPGYDPYADYPDGAVFNNNFIKFRELSLNYTLPSKFAAKLKLQKCVLSVYGRNLFYIYKSIPAGLDPEDAVGTNYLNYATSVGTGNAATRSIGGSLRVSF